MATATTTTKRPRKSASSKAPAVEETAAEETPAPQTDNGAALTAAYWQALDGRTPKGAISDDLLAAVKAAYARTDPKRRPNVVKNLTIASGERIVSDDGEVDQTIALARKQLSGVLAEVREQASRSERPPHDPVPDLAHTFAAIERWRATLLAELNDDQRERLADLQVDENDDAATAADERVSKALDRIRHYAIKGRNGHAAPRAPIADVEAKVIKAVHDAHPTPLTTTELAKAADIPQATAYTRWTKTKTPGVKATTDDKGRKVFVKDTDAA